MDIRFYVTFDGTTLQLPVNPESVAVSYQGDRNSTEIVTIGEVSLLKNRQLATISFESFFPYGTWYPGILVSRLYKPNYYRDFLVEMMESDKPGRLTITGIGVNMYVSIDNLVCTSRSGLHEDIEYNITFREYRPFSITKIDLDLSSTIVQPTVKTNPATGGTTQPTEITVGSVVLVSGQLHKTSYGESPGSTLKSYRAQVNYINNPGTHPIHVKNIGANDLGWVRRGDVSLA